MISLAISLLKVVIEIASFVLPTVFGVYFLFRRSEAYDESFVHSRFASLGLSKRVYRITFRLLGILLIMIATVIVWNFYMADLIKSEGETEFFWKDIEKKDDDGNVLFKLSMLGAVIAIPARMASVRFAGKPLADLNGKAVIEHVFEKCTQSKLAGGIVILSDSPEIEEKAAQMGARHIMTSPECSSGTERIVSVLDELDANFIVNVQGDEPFIAPELIDSLIKKHQETSAELVTAVRRIHDVESLKNENVVKVLRNASGRLIYFSRSPLPYLRGQGDYSKWLEASAYWQHIGIYGYSADILKKYAALPESVLENCEKLEQLKFLSAGYTFEIVETDYVSIGIDTPEDLQKAKDYLNKIS